MELGLKNKIALVTGSSRGIGRGVALALAAEGCDVMLTGRDQTALEEVAAAIRKQGRKAVISVIDLREKEAPTKLIERTRRELGGLDILVNNAGATKRGDFMELTDADFEDGYALKFFGHVRLTRAAWPLLKERRGSLITIGGTGRNAAPDRRAAQHGIARHSCRRRHEEAACRRRQRSHPLHARRICRQYSARGRQVGRPRQEARAETRIGGAIGKRHCEQARRFSLRRRLDRVVALPRAVT